MTSEHIEQRQEQHNKDVAYIYESIKDALLEAGYAVEVNNRRSYDDWEHSINITHPELKYFEASITKDRYGEKAELRFQRGHDVYTVLRTDDNGVSQTHREEYEFCYMLNDSKLEKIGIPKVDYRRSVYSLHKSFKATKKAKLILNDILPALAIYKNLVEAASPEIDRRIKRAEEVLAFQNEMYRQAEHFHGPKKIARDIEFDIKGVGRVSISSHGSIELRTEPTWDELRELVKNREVN